MVYSYLSRDEYRSQNCKLVEAFAEAPLWNASRKSRVSLPLSTRDIIGGDITGYIFKCVFLGDVLPSLADYYGLMVDE